LIGIHHKRVYIGLPSRYFFSLYFIFSFLDIQSFLPSGSSAEIIMDTGALEQSGVVDIALKLHIHYAEV